MNCLYLRQKGLYMKKDVFEQQKAFAGEKIPSMSRRMVGHDYQQRQMYMITMAIEDRRPLLGKVVGRSDGQKGSPEEPHVELTVLGKQVEQNWYDIAIRYPQIQVLALQIMPDHFHGILFVKEHLDKPLGKVLLGFKQGCNKAYRSLVLNAQHAEASHAAVPHVAVLQQHTRQPEQHTEQPEQHTEQPSQKKEQPSQKKEDRKHGLLFERSYNDSILMHAGQLKRWYDYLADNPRRLLMKCEHPDLFRIQRGLTVGALSFSAIGNRFLLQKPVLMQVQCSRRMTEEEIKNKVDECLRAASQGAVLVSPSISPGEKAVMRAAFDKGFPLIILQENGFSDLAKPGGKRMDACAEGRLLILAPWQHHNERIAIRRDQCLSLNEMARLICSSV